VSAYREFQLRVRKFYALDCNSNSRGGFCSGGFLVSRFAGFVRWEVRKTR
jgi:hypothetical protein